MSQEQTVATADQGRNEFLNQPIQTSLSYGGTGGGSFACSFGNYITEIKAFTASGYDLAGLHITFDSGDVFHIGSGQTELSNVYLDSDSISRMYVQVLQDSNKWGGNHLGIDNIYFETVHGVQYASTPRVTPLDGHSTGWTLVTDTDGTTPCENMVLVGLSGRAGSGIDALSFMYKEDILKSRSMDDFNYSNLSQTASQPINVATATVHNQTDEEQEMSLSFERSVSSSYTWTVATGVTVGASAKFKTGVPFIAKGEVTVSAEVSFTATLGETHTTSDAFSYAAVVKVPGNSGVVANAVASSSNISGSYTARYLENWSHAGLVTDSISGNISGLTAYNVTVDYDDAS